MALCQQSLRFAPLVGRVLLANIFLLSGYQKIVGFATSAGYMAGKMPSLDPTVIKVLLVLTIVVELGGGLMIVLGWQARWGALAIAVWLIPVTLIFHGYWAVPPEETRMQFIQFQKNVAILGGLLYIAAFGSGPFSLRRERCEAAL